MLLKILLLQVMSIGLITVPIKAQDSLVELPDLYMEDSDKAVMNSIWNMAGFPSDQGEPTNVDRKFFATLGRAVPVLQHVPYMTPGIVGFPYNHHQQFNDNKQNKQIHQTGGTYTGSPTTINYRVLPKPPNSELESSEENDSPVLINNRRTLHPEKVNLGITDANDKETNIEYLSMENLETSPQNLETVDLPLERMERMMQFKVADDNIHINKKSKDSMRRNSDQIIEAGGQSHYSTIEVDIPSKIRKNNNATIMPNSHIEIPKNYMHKKKYNRKPANATRNSETSTHHPTVANYKYTRKRKELNRKSEKSPDTRKYYEIFDNNQKYMCKCNLMRRKNEELNARKAYTETSIDNRHDQVFNCTKYCNVTKRNDAETTEKDNLRWRNKHDKEKYHKEKRDNEGDGSGDEEPVKTKATRSQKFRNKQRNQEYNAGTEKEIILDNHQEVTEGDKIYLPTENHFPINAEYRSSIDPVQAYADESAYRPVVNPMFGYPDEVENHPETDSMRRYADEPDYGDMAIYSGKKNSNEPDYRQVIPQMNSYVYDSDYRAMDDVNPSDYTAGSPVEVLHNVEGYNPFMHQYSNEPQEYMYEQIPDSGATLMYGK